MKSVGKQLQEARLAKNWTPELAARETKIKVDRLHDLEGDDYTHFSSPAYARGFVRTYARSLGLDEYKILRQLDNKLPDDDTPALATDSGVAYLPETSMPPRVAHRDFTGLYIVMALACGILLIIAFVLFEAYRVGELSSVFADTSSSETGSKTADATNGPAGAETETPPHALPVDPNDTAHAPKAEAVDLSALAAGTNAAPTADVPLHALKALPVDASELTNAPSSMPPSAIASPITTNAPALTAIDTKTPPRALPVDLNELNAAPAIAAPPAAAPPPSASPMSLSARQSNSRPVAIPPVPAIAPPVAPTVTAATNATSLAAATTNSAPQAPPAPPPTPDVEKRLVLTASQDSFVRVTSLDPTSAEKPLYASVLHSGQSVGFDGHKFSINVGVPSAIDIKLDGVNYGPHSDHEAPETFTVESRQP